MAQLPKQALNVCPTVDGQRPADWFVPDSSACSACSACRAEERLPALATHLPHQPPNHVPADQGAFCLAMLALCGRCRDVCSFLAGPRTRVEVLGVPWALLCVSFFLCGQAALPFAALGRCFEIQRTRKPRLPSIHDYAPVVIVGGRRRRHRPPAPPRVLFRGVTEEPCGFKAI